MPDRCFTFLRETGFVFISLLRVSLTTDVDMFYWSIVVCELKNPFGLQLKIKKFLRLACACHFATGMLEGGLQTRINQHPDMPIQDRGRMPNPRGPSCEHQLNAQVQLKTGCRELDCLLNVGRHY
jgi:hypothetical protein